MSARLGSWIVRTIATLGILAAVVGFAGLAQAGPRENVVQQIRADGDPAKDVMWRSDQWLYVGVLDDGTVRDGLASYYCNLVSAAGLHGKFVKIIDIAKLSRRGEWVPLGQASCDFGG